MIASATYSVHCTVTECESILSKPGKYQYDSATGDSTCTAFILGPPDKLVRITFDTFQLQCDSRSLLTVYVYDATVTSQHEDWLTSSHDIKIKSYYRAFAISKLLQLLANWRHSFSLYCNCKKNVTSPFIEIVSTVFLSSSNIVINLFWAQYNNMPNVVR